MALDDYEITPKDNKRLIELMGRSEAMGLPTSLADDRCARRMLLFCSKFNIQTNINPDLLIDKLRQHKVSLTWLDHQEAFFTKDRNFVLVSHPYELNNERMEGLREAIEVLNAELYVDAWLSWWHPNNTLLVVLKIPR